MIKEQDERGTWKYWLRIIAVTLWSAFLGGLG